MALTQWHEIRGKMSVALEVGVEAALLLEDIYYWVNHNRAALLLEDIYYWVNHNREREHNFNDGYYWTVNSYPKRRNPPNFSYGDIRRVHRIYVSN